MLDIAFDLAIEVHSYYINEYAKGKTDQDFTKYLHLERLQEVKESIYDRFLLEVFEKKTEIAREDFIGRFYGP